MDCTASGGECAEGRGGGGVSLPKASTKRGAEGREARLLFTGMEINISPH